MRDHSYWNASISCMLVVASLIGVSRCDLINQPAYSTFKIQKNSTDVSMNDFQTRKITTKTDGIGIFNMNLTLVSGKEFCYGMNRMINYEMTSQFALFEQRQSDLFGETYNDNPIIIAWTYLTASKYVQNANLVSIDTKGAIKFFRTNPISGETTILSTLDLSKSVAIDILLMETVYIQQTGISIYIGTSDRSNIIKMYKLAYSQEDGNWSISLDQTVNFLKDYGEFTDMISYQNQTTSFSLLFVVQEKKMTVVQVKAGEMLSTNVVATDLLVHQFTNIRLFQNSPGELFIFLLCAQNGIFKYFLTIPDNGNLSGDIKMDSSFQIKIKYGEVFNQYRGRVFFVTTSEDLYQTYEYEILLSHPSDYYLNRIHYTDHKVRDIYMQSYYALLVGRNTHTVSWHSVHPSIIPNIVDQQQYFSIYSMNGGVFDTYYNKDTNSTDIYLIAFQNRHIAILKEVHISPYILCQPFKYMNFDEINNSSEESQDINGIIGTNQFILSMIEKNTVSANSFQTQTSYETWNITVNKVYADKMTAAAIAGIVIGSVVVFSIIIGVIIFKIRRQSITKTLLQEAIHKEQQKKKSQKFSPVQDHGTNQEISSEQLPAQKINAQNRRGNSESESGDNNLIIQFDEED